MLGVSLAKPMVHLYEFFYRVISLIFAEWLSKQSLARWVATFTRHTRLTSFCLDYFSFSLIFKRCNIRQENQNLWTQIVLKQEQNYQKCVYFNTLENICKRGKNMISEGGGNIIFDVKYRPLMKATKSHCHWFSFLATIL